VKVYMTFKSVRLLKKVEKRNRIAAATLLLPANRFVSRFGPRHNQPPALNSREPNLLREFGRFERHRADQVQILEGTDVNRPETKRIADL